MRNNTGFNLSNNILRSSIRYREMLWKKEIVFTETYNSDVNQSSMMQIILNGDRRNIPDLKLGFIPKVEGDSIIYSPDINLLTTDRNNDIATVLMNHMEFVNIYKGHLDNGEGSVLETLSGNTRTQAEELLFKRMMGSLETDILAAKDTKFLKLAEKQVIQERLGQIDNEIAMLVEKEKNLRETQASAQKEDIIKTAVASIEELVTRRLYVEINFTMQGVEAISKTIVVPADYSEEQYWRHASHMVDALGIEKGKTYYYCLGAFKITIPWHGSNVNVRPIWRNKDTLNFQNGGHRDGHPHISNSNPCLGSKGGKIINNKMKAGDIKGALLHMYNFVNDYNPSNPYGHTPEYLSKPYLSAQEALDNALAKQRRNTNQEEIPDEQGESVEIDV